MLAFILTLPADVTSDGFPPQTLLFQAETYPLVAQDSNQVWQLRPELGPSLNLTIRENCLKKKFFFVL